MSILYITFFLLCVHFTSGFEVPWLDNNQFNQQKMLTENLTQEIDEIGMHQMVIKLTNALLDKDYQNMEQMQNDDAIGHPDSKITVEFSTNLNTDIGVVVDGQEDGGVELPKHGNDKNAEVVDECENKWNMGKFVRICREFSIFLFGFAFGLLAAYFMHVLNNRKLKLKKSSNEEG